MNSQLTLVSPFDFALPEKWVTIDPSLFSYVGLSPHAETFKKRTPEENEALAKLFGLSETKAKRSAKRAEKATNQNLRQSTLAPDSVEAVLLWKAGHGHGTRYSKALSKVQARSDQRESKVQGVPSEGEIHEERAKTTHRCAQCCGRKHVRRNEGMIYGRCSHCDQFRYLFP